MTIKATQLILGLLCLVNGKVITMTHKKNMSILYIDIFLVGLQIYSMGKRKQ